MDGKRILISRGLVVSGVCFILYLAMMASYRRKLPIFSDLQAQNAFRNPPGPAIATSSAEKETPVKSNAKIILVIAYMRSGSTLTGSILQEFPESFYVFEPIRIVYERAMNKNTTLTDLHGRTRHVSKASWEKEMVNVLHRWLQCDLENLDIDTLMDPFLQKFSTKMRRFSDCQRRPPTRAGGRTQQAVNGSKFVESKLDAIIRCLPLAKQLCEDSAVRVFKLIRLEMRTVRDLMPFYPNMQVIHLLRDPRGMLDSQGRYDMMRKDLAQQANVYCRKMYYDLSFTRLLLEQYPERMKLLLYEDLTASPINVTEDLYRFAKLPITKAIYQYVQNMTSSDHNKPCVFCIRKSNSSKTANKWRTHVTQKTVKSINSKCADVYSLLGYKNLNNFTDVVNLSKPTRYKIDVVNVIKNFKFNQSKVKHFETRFSRFDL